jgi:hypothetical protein
MPVIKNKKLKKALVAPAHSKVKKTKNPQAYFKCMSACCRGKISPKNISQVAQECKTKALALNAKLSKQKAQAIKKIKTGYQQLGKGLDEFIKSK